MSEAVSGDNQSLCTDSAVRKLRLPRKDYTALLNPAPLDGDTDTSDDPDYVGNTNSEDARMSPSCFTCVICFADAPDKCSHLEHLAAAHPNLKTHCLACESQYDRYADYTKHLRDCHPRVLQSIDEAEGLHCLECGKGFNKKSYLYQHRAQHFMLNRVPCDVCGKSFLEGAMLERHLDTHKEPSTHKCSRCQRTFRSALGLARHDRAHRRHKHFCQVVHQSTCAPLFTAVLGCISYGLSRTPTWSLHKFSKTGAVMVPYIATLLVRMLC